MNFIEGEDRLVFITGEAYLDVVKDTNKPFVVNANTVNIKVFGTKFNIHAYPEDYVTEVVLVSGSVGLYKQEDNSEMTYLEPGFKASFNKNSEEIYKTQVLTNIYTSWIDGELVFRDMDFDNILRKLERFYDIKITNNNTRLASQKFQASFGKNPDIEQVFKELKMIYKIDYSIDGRSIIIK
ncbi:putative anti-sigma factor [Algibacter lectus]|uniref:Putative anti-sigma factor n=1 Tax=Algibacter lectus TaxID=221126 RepID=A0A090WYJ2_9FLAO|nr:putative anti-sigma factor [Algibacter lectus]